MPKRHRPGASEASVFAYLDEVVSAASGEDAFELAFALAARRIVRARTARRDAKGGDANLKAQLAELADRWPLLGVRPPSEVSEAFLVKVDAALQGGLPWSREGSIRALDALFEALVPRLSKGEKGQFFTPRHVVEFIVRALAPGPRELVVDPACGSGAFLSTAFASSKAKTRGTDIDARAVRVARLAALAQGRDLETISRADGLLSARDGSSRPVAHVVATNPPFAGRLEVPRDSFELARILRRPERDALFLEKSLTLLKPRGRLGIVLPHNKVAGTSFAALRRWLSSRARIFAVVSLPRETFLPYTSLRTAVLFAKRRTAGELPSPDERTLFAVSARAGKDASGAPLFRPGDPAIALDHDLDDVDARLSPFLRAEGFFS